MKGWRGARIGGLPAAFFPAFLAAVPLVAGAGCGDGESGAPPPAHLSTAPGTPAGEAASATIGAAGGTLASADGGLSVTIPAGAVAADTLFTVTPLAAPAANAVATYRLDPAGTAFAVPVTLSFDAAGAGATHAGLAFLGVALHEAAGTWRWIPDAEKDATAKTVAVQVSHFSEYSMLSGYQFQPLATTAEVGGAAEFAVVACADPWMLAMINGEVPEDTPVEVPDPLVYECKPVFFDGARADRWSVDGVEGGDAAHGTIQANGDVAAVYYAPGKKPDPATVSVSTLFHYAGFNSLQDLLVGRVTVTDDQKWFGSFLVKAYGPMVWAEWTATGEATWTTGDNPYEYVVSGTVKADQTIYSMGDATCTLVGAERPFTWDSGEVHEAGDRATVYWGIPQVFWPARCCDSGGGCQDVEQFLSLLWASGCATEWAELDEAEWKDNGAMKGSYTWPGSPCMPTYPGMPTATVEWLFLPYGGTE